MEDPSQLHGSDFKHQADGHGSGAGCAELVGTGHALLTEEVSLCKERNCGFFAGFGHNRELSPAPPKVKQAVGGISLSRKNLFSVEANHFSSRPRSREVSINIERFLAFFGHNQALHSRAVAV